jgi:type II secretory pathway component PulF
MEPRPRAVLSAARPRARPELGARLRRAWLLHPLVAFARHRTLITFYRQLHAVVRAGLPLPTAFAQLVEYAPSAAMREGLSAVAAEVREGSTLAGAMRRHGALFDDANVELLAFAEEAGRLEPILATLSDHLEQVQKQRWQALTGAIWPAYLGASLLFVGPLLGAAQALKPGGSVAALYLGGLAGNLSTMLLVGSAVLGAPFAVAALGLEVPWDRFKRRLPGLAAPLRQLAASRFVLGLGLANASGLEVMRALALSVKATGSPAVGERLPVAEAMLRRGSTLTEAVASLGLLDRTSLGSLSVAETTGTLSTALERMSRELQESAMRATRLLVVLVTAAVAGVALVKIVGAMLGVLFGPIKAMYDAAGSGKFDG